jgi:hypothetical protein
MNKQLDFKTALAARPANENSVLRLEPLQIIASAEPAVWSLLGKRRTADWSMAGTEPTLEEALAEPIVRLVMERDGVDDEDVYAAATLAGFR